VSLNEIRQSRRVIEMNKKKLGKLIVFVVILISIPFIFLFPYRESEEFKGFPVPMTAELTENKSKLEKYNWGSASEENGLPLRYQLIIKLWGWEKKEQEGALSIYEKNGIEVGVISLTDYLSLSSY
jgi:hypothetical protein